MRNISFLVAMATSALLAQPARAQTAEEFYRGNDVSLLVAADIGGGYDVYARAVAPFLKRHLPGQPNVIVQNMPGAGGIRMANHLANAVKADGATVGLALSPIVLNQLTRPGQVRYDAAAFAWIGTIDSQTNVLTVWAAKTPIRSIEQAKTATITVGATNPSSFLHQEPTLMNALLDTKFKIVSGYKGVRDLNLALERGEIDAQVSPWSTWKSERPDWLSSGKIVNIIASGAPASDLPGVPMFANLVKDARGKALVALLDSSSIVGRSIAAPRSTPPDRVAALREALAKAAADPEFIAEMAKRGLPVQYRSGDQLQTTVAETLKTPPEAIKAFVDLFGAQ
jgi:tripartite-type tricarboxylate transporter receptor subunit TctC